jgi:hypothetical protein
MLALVHGGFVVQVHIHGDRMTTATERLDAPYATDWSFGIQWRFLVAAALVGFGVTVIMMTLGAAIGLTAATASNGANGKAVGIGAGIWWLITSAVAGFLAGRVLHSTARRDLEYRPAIYATAAWALGVIFLLFLLANGLGNVVGGMGGGLGAAAANAQTTRPNISPADSAQMLHTAATVGTGAAWGLFISQIVGLGATILGAGRRDRAYVRPAATR